VVWEGKTKAEWGDHARVLRSTERKTGPDIRPAHAAQKNFQGKRLRTTRRRTAQNKESEKTKKTKTINEVRRLKPLARDNIRQWNNRYNKEDKTWKKKNKKKSPKKKKKRRGQGVKGVSTAQKGKVVKKGRKCDL